MHAIVLESWDDGWDKADCGLAGFGTDGRLVR